MDYAFSLKKSTQRARSRWAVLCMAIATTFSGLMLNPKVALAKGEVFGQPIQFSPTNVGASAIIYDGTYLWTANNTYTDGLGSPSAVSRTLYLAEGNVKVVTFPLALEAKGPIGLAVVGNNIWTANASTNNLSKINRDTGVNQTIALPPGADNPSGITFDGAFLWVANLGKIGATKVVSRVSPETGIGENFALPMGVLSPKGIVFSAGSIWVIDYDSSILTQISPMIGKMIKHALGANVKGSTAIAAGGDYLVIANGFSNNVTRVKLVADSFNSAQNFALPPGAAYPVAVTFFGDSIWTTNTQSTNISRINWETGIGENIPQPAGVLQPFGLAPAQKQLFILGTKNDTLIPLLDF